MAAGSYCFISHSWKEEAVTESFILSVLQSVKQRLKKKSLEEPRSHRDLIKKLFHDFKGSE